MSCDEIMRRLDELLDDELEGGGREGMREHLAGCVSCRQEMARAERLRRLVSTLPQRVEPERDLWLEIAERLQSARPARAPRRLPRAVLAIAAVLLVALAAALAYRAGRAQSPAGRAATPAGSGVVLAGNTSPALGAAREEILAARDQVWAAVAARRDELSPETMRVVDENLRLIDDAIARITAAFQEDPGNPELTRLLAAAYRQQIDLLQRVARLPAAA